MTSALGINPLDEQWARGGDATAELAALDVLVKAQLEARTQARTEKNWAESDKIRDVLAAAGIDIADSANGSTWSLRR
jgi:cysteinyl-tRNA synthetase